MKIEIAEVKSEIATMKADISQIKELVVAIYQAIQKPSGN